MRSLLESDAGHHHLIQGSITVTVLTLIGFSSFAMLVQFRVVVMNLEVRFIIGLKKSTVSGERSNLLDFVNRLSKLGLRLNKFIGLVRQMN